MKDITASRYPIMGGMGRNKLTGMQWFSVTLVEKVEPRKERSEVDPSLRENHAIPNMGSWKGWKGALP